MEGCRLGFDVSGWGLVISEKAINAWEEEILAGKS